MQQIVAPSVPPTPTPEPMPMRRCGFCRGSGLSENLGVNLESIGERPCFFCEGTGQVPDYRPEHYAKKETPR